MCEHCGHPIHGWNKCTEPGIQAQYTKYIENGVAQTAVLSCVCQCTPVVLEGNI